MLYTQISGKVMNVYILPFNLINANGQIASFVF